MNVSALTYYNSKEFISNQTKFYYDKFHGYWIELYQRNSEWVWIDGHKDTLDIFKSIGMLVVGLTTEH